MIDYGVTIPNYLQCMPTTIYVDRIEYGERKTKSGIIIPTETMDYQGYFARPRWCRVKYKADNINFVNEGEWVLLQHGHWSTSMKMEINGFQQKVWYISPKSLKEGLIAWSKEMPSHLKEYGFDGEE